MASGGAGASAGRTLFPTVPTEDIGDPPTVEELNAHARICMIEGAVVQLTRATTSFPNGFFDHFSWVKLLDFRSSVTSHANDTEADIAAWHASMAELGTCHDAKTIERGPDVDRGKANSFVECKHAIEVVLVRTIETDGTVDGAMVKLPGMSVTFIVNLEYEKRKETWNEGCVTPHIGVLRKIGRGPGVPTTPSRAAGGAGGARGSATATTATAATAATAAAYPPSYSFEPPPRRTQRKQRKQRKQQTQRKRRTQRKQRTQRR